MAPSDQAYAYGNQAYAYPYAYGGERTGVRGDRGYEDTYVVVDRRENIGAFGGAGTFAIAHDAGDEIVEIVLTLTLAADPNQTPLIVSNNLNEFGDNPGLLALAQTAMAILTFDQGDSEDLGLLSAIDFDEGDSTA